ncbi:zinc ribbon domain-containing protein [Egibacter rhizosphaerae]|uniref:Zinc ribbon domain-containing protein n=1 Tax=Egibacter rhizosphaerae TaxID=1670831 RepID=A0A411YK55_9ACTN|nr:zinc ribbon domain-containing protein [Egibacter rhizosphaerae]
MPTYEYRCGHCGPFELQRAMGEAPQHHDCPGCHTPVRRAISAPHVNRFPEALAREITRAERSQDEPEVVTSLPPPTGRRASTGGSNVPPRPVPPPPRR